MHPGYRAEVKEVSQNYYSMLLWLLLLLLTLLLTLLLLLLEIHVTESYKINFFIPVPSLCAMTRSPRMRRHLDTAVKVASLAVWLSPHPEYIPSPHFRKATSSSLSAKRTIPPVIAYQPSIHRPHGGEVVLTVGGMREFHL